MLLFKFNFIDCFNVIFRNEPSTEKEYNSIHPHWDSNSGLILMAKLSLHAKFPEILSQGYQYFHEANKPPVIYCGDDLIGQQICMSVSNQQRGTLKQRQCSHFLLLLLINSWDFQ